MANLEELGCVIYETLMKSSLKLDRSTFLRLFTKEIKDGHVDVRFDDKLVQFRADFTSGNLSKVIVYATSPFSLVDTVSITHDLRINVKLDA